MRSRILTLIILLSTAVVVFAASSVPLIISFQGRLSENGTPVDGTRTMRFAIVNEGASTTYWQSHASNSVTVTVNRGIYTVKLGDTSLSNMAALTDRTFDQSEKLYVRVWVQGEQLSPDILLAATPYASISRQTELVTKNAAAGTSVGEALSMATKNIELNVDLTITGTADVKVLKIDGVSVSSSNNVLIFEY